MIRAYLLFFFLCSFAHAQYAETIQSGRPGQAIGPRTVGAKVFQLQSGLNNNIFSLNAQKQTTFSHSTVVRFGLVEKLEASFLTTWQLDSFEPQSSPNFGGISDTQLGVRYDLLLNKGWIPNLGIQGRVLFRAQSEAYRRENIGANFILATNNGINDWLSLTTNWAMVFTGNGTVDYIYVINLSSGITEKFGVFGEVYGNLNTIDYNFDTGISYLLSKDLQLDASFGFLIDGLGSNWFIDTGISWRIDWR